MQNAMCDIFTTKHLLAHRRHPSLFRHSLSLSLSLSLWLLGRESTRTMAPSSSFSYPFLSSFSSSYPFGACCWHRRLSLFVFLLTLHNFIAFLLFLCALLWLWIRLVFHFLDNPTSQFFPPKATLTL